MWSLTKIGLHQVRNPHLYVNILHSINKTRTTCYQGGKLLYTPIIAHNLLSSKFDS